MTLLDLPVTAIRPNPYQPRHDFNPDDLESLADSIRQHGLLQPVEVERVNDGSYILHHGERRWRACQMAGLTTIRAIEVAPLSDNDLLVRALVENLQRTDMNPIDEALAYRQLLVWYPSPAHVGRAVGRSLTTVNSRLRLLDLPPETQALVAGGALPRDVRVADAILELPESARVQFAVACAAQSLPTKAILAAAEKLQAKLTAGADREAQPERHYETRQPLDTIAPALDLVYGAGGQGRLPPAYQLSVEGTCRVCPWFTASKTQRPCGECPLTVFVRTMAAHVEVTMP